MRATALILIGVVYLTLVFFYGVESPVFGLGFIALAAYELLRMHRTGRRHL